ncbi:MAG: hypothetical protein VZR27_10235 [Acutalibacteraceae bacterium]|nr:hypothetical protein [Acutalibacteraceae bacterium]
MKKYELTDETKIYFDRTLHRIKALRDIGEDVKTGDLGGWIEKESNLSHDGDAWVYGNAQVYGNAKVTEITDVFAVSPIGSRNDTTTFYRTKDDKIFVKCGCKNTDIDTWLAMVKKTHGDNKHAQAYKLAAQIARLQILGEEE